MYKHWKIRKKYKERESEVQLKNSTSTLAQKEEEYENISKDIVFGCA